MKYIANAMKFSPQSRSNSLILNMIFEIADLDRKLKTWAVWSENCNVLQFLRNLELSANGTCLL